MIMTHAKLPPEIEEIPDSIARLNRVIQNWDMIYKMNQTGNVGGYHVHELRSGLSVNHGALLSVFHSQMKLV